MVLHHSNQALTLMPSPEIPSQEAQAGFLVSEISAKHLAVLQVKVIYSRSYSAVLSVAERALAVSHKVPEERTLRHVSMSHFWTLAKEQLVVSISTLFQRVQRVVVLA